MEAIKNFLKTKGIGWYVSLATCVMALIAFICYTVRGGHPLSPINGGAVACIVIGLVANVVVLWKDFKVGAFVPLMMYAGALAILLDSEMGYISNVAFGVDGNSLDSLYMTILVGIVLSVIGAAVAAVMGLTKQTNDNSSNE